MNLQTHRQLKRLVDENGEPHNCYSYIYTSYRHLSSQNVPDMRQVCSVGLARAPIVALEAADRPFRSRRSVVARFRDGVDERGRLRRPLDGRRSGVSVGCRGGHAVDVFECFLDSLLAVLTRHPVDRDRLSHARVNVRGPTLSAFLLRD